MAKITEADIEDAKQDWYDSVSKEYKGLINAKIDD
jgi:hypothetical protein